MLDDFEGKSKTPKVPNFDEFDPSTMDETKMHAICRNKSESAVEGELLASQLSYQEFVAGFTELVASNQSVEFVVADEKREFVIVRGEDDLQEILIDGVPPELPGQIMRGDRMKETLMQIKEANRAVQEQQAAPQEDYPDPSTFS